MNKMQKRTWLGGVLGTLFLASTASAAPVVLDFEGLQDQEQILDFYNGGTGSAGSSSGMDYDIVFGSGALALIDSDGANATGNILGTLNLSANYTANNCTGDPTGTFCNWDAIGVAFAGTAFSVSFAGTANQTGFDDITLFSDVPGQVPEPATLALLGLGLVGLGVARRKARS